MKHSDSLDRILVINNIAQAGLKVFGEKFIVGKEISHPDAIIVRSSPIDTGKFPNLIAVARAGIGVDKITVEQATETGICVFNTPGANARAVAEIVMTTIGAQSRNLFAAVQFMRSLTAFSAAKLEEYIETNKSNYVGRELEGQTLGVIGLGKIGVLVANLGLQKGMHVIGFDPSLTTQNAHSLDRAVQVVKSLDQLIEAANVITVHVPLTSNTKHLIDAEQIARMREGVTLVNYSRKGVYNDNAVVEAIAAKHVSSYITDFATPEMAGNPNVIPTPHLGASTAESEDKCAVMAARQLADFLERGTVVNSVNFPTAELIPGNEASIRLVVVNKDVPGMIAAITNALGEAGINISRSLNESNGKIGYNIIDTISSELPPGLIRTIGDIANVLNARFIRLK